MTRTKATVKRRQQKRRLEREADKSRLAEAREAEQPQLAEPDGCEEAGEPIAVQDGEAHDALGNEESERKGKEQEEKQEEEKVEEEEGDDDDDEEVEEEAGVNDGEEGQLLLTDYEKQREQRIKENAAKLATLNLTSLASSFRPSTRSQRQSSSKRKKDVDYMPSSSSDSEGSDNNDTHKDQTRPHKQQDDNGDLDEDEALQQAIAMSLNTPPADNEADSRSRGLRAQKNKRQVSDKKGSAKKKRKGPQEQFSVDEIASIFAIIDEQGNGKFSVAELERVARSHDFTWSKQEIADMIDVFDSNKDGQLDLSEFQSIFGRMNMLRMRVT